MTTTALAQSQTGTGVPENFNPSKQHLRELVKGEIILVGDVLVHKDFPMCQITVQSITRSHSLNLVVTYTTGLMPVSFTDVKYPTQLENLLLSQHGAHPAILPQTFRKSWPSFEVQRSGQRLGTLADLRAYLGRLRLRGDQRILALLPFRPREPKAEPEGGEEDVPQSQETGERPTSPPSDEPAEMSELRAQVAALQATQHEIMALARRQHELLSDLKLFIYDDGFQTVIKPEMSLLERSTPSDLWAAVTKKDEEGEEELNENEDVSMNCT